MDVRFSLPCALVNSWAVAWTYEDARHPEPYNIDWVLLEEIADWVADQALDCLIWSPRVGEFEIVFSDVEAAILFQLRWHG